MAKPQELKSLPCPFCKSTKIFALPGLDWVSCQNPKCGASGPHVDAKPIQHKIMNIAIRAWNKAKR